jgi:hypothetical protein
LPGGERGGHLGVRRVDAGLLGARHRRLRAVARGSLADARVLREGTSTSST